MNTENEDRIKREAEAKEAASKRAAEKEEQRQKDAAMREDRIKREAEAKAEREKEEAIQAERDAVREREDRLRQEKADAEEAVKDEVRRTRTVPEAAKILGVGRNQMYEACRTGQISTIRIGHRILIPIAVLERLLSEATLQGYREVEPLPSNNPKYVRIGDK